MPELDVPYELHINEQGRWQLLEQFANGERMAAIERAKELELRKPHMMIKLVRALFEEQRGKWREMAIFKSAALKVHENRLATTIALERYGVYHGGTGRALFVKDFRLRNERELFEFVAIYEKKNPGIVVHVAKESLNVNNKVITQNVIYKTGSDTKFFDRLDIRNKKVAKTASPTSKKRNGKRPSSRLVKTLGNNVSFFLSLIISIMFVPVAVYVAGRYSGQIVIDIIGKDGFGLYLIAVAVLSMMAVLVGLMWLNDISIPAFFEKLGSRQPAPVVEQPPTESERNAAPRTPPAAPDVDALWAEMWATIAAAVPAEAQNPSPRVERFFALLAEGVMDFLVCRPEGLAAAHRAKLLASQEELTALGSDSICRYVALTQNCTEAYRSVFLRGQGWGDRLFRQRKMPLGVADALNAFLRASADIEELTDLAFIAVEPAGAFSLAYDRAVAGILGGLSRGQFVLPSGGKRGLPVHVFENKTHGILAVEKLHGAILAGMGQYATGMVVGDAIIQSGELAGPIVVPLREAIRKAAETGDVIVMAEIASMFPPQIRLSSIFFGLGDAWTTRQIGPPPAAATA